MSKVERLRPVEQALDVEQEDTAGYTVWGRKQDNSLRAVHVESVDDAVERSIATDAP